MDLMEGFEPWKIARWRMMLALLQCDMAQAETLAILNNYIRCFYIYMDILDIYPCLYIPKQGSCPSPRS